MLDSVHVEGIDAHTAVIAPPTAVNTTTKEELLQRAKAAVEAGEQSLRDAAEALGLAREDHSATQREMAEAIGKSASWVNKLLKWRSSGYKDHSPFGPTTRRGRVEHAQQRTKASKPRGVASKPDADDAEASAEKRKAEYAKQETKLAEPGPEDERDEDSENIPADFMTRADMARRFAVYSGPASEEIVAMARSAAAAWNKLVRSLAKSLPA
jgi:hypothetical protein